MDKKLLVHEDDKLRESWCKLYETGEYETVLVIDESDKLDILKAVYGGLYSELRDKHSRQQQIVAWGFTVLTGAGFITLTISNTLSLTGAIIFSIILALLTFVLSRTIRFLSRDRMSIARQLDRIHQIMGIFEKGFYCKDTTLLDPVWYGWGFDKTRDANWKLSGFYQLVLWVIYGLDVLLLINKTGLIALVR